MTGVRRRGYLTAAVAVMGAALLTGLLATPPDRPVDIRLVAPPPPPPEVITATATTAVSAVAPELRPPPPPPPPPRQPGGVKPPPRHKPPVPPPPPERLPPNLFDFLRCDHDYLGVIDLERCLEWPLDDTKEFCKLLKEQQKSQPIDLRALGFEELDCH
jgi:hypothetical protein